MKVNKKLKKNNSPESRTWLSLLLMLRLAFRLISVMNALGIVLFYNVSLFMKLPMPRFVLPGYILLMGALEVYLVIALRKGVFPITALAVYFITALLFELPYAVLSADSLGLKLFVLPWYLSVIIGFGLVLNELRNIVLVRRR
ncbi:hypothetical protein NF865_02600 [Thermococcus aggregans]|uniref:Uncharacterized protein n=1 Tax=Thermococcus aggregans TaxID=110163 RepID=A0A9E7MYE3_THEAG|nr:hypothetical protein [Thermococcus aggregans]USS41120.1 hypothetical protein NF865_02600 [Thermococcus aggregans]